MTSEKTIPGMVLGAAGRVVGRAFYWLFLVPAGLIALYLFAWPTFFVVRRVVAPVLYYSLLGYATVIDALFFVVSWLWRLVGDYLIEPPAQRLAEFYALHFKMPKVSEQLRVVRAYCGLEARESFSHEQLVYGPHRYELGRVQMTIRTAEAAIFFADQQTYRGNWLGALEQLRRAETHLANARAEMCSLVAANPGCCISNALPA